MSLTREEWIEIWVAIKVIESITKLRKNNSAGKRTTLAKVDLIKQKIQSVIGQME